MTKFQPNDYRVRDYEIVEAEPLGEILRAWIVRYLAARPAKAMAVTTDPDYSTPVAHFGPIQWLSFHTGIHIKRTSEICNSKLEFVTFSEADKLLTAIGEEHHLREGTVEVFPNPHLSREEYERRRAERGCA